MARYYWVPLGGEEHETVPRSAALFSSYESALKTAIQQKSPVHQVDMPAEFVERGGSHFWIREDSGVETWPVALVMWPDGVCPLDAFVHQMTHPSAPPEKPPPLAARELDPVTKPSEEEVRRFRVTHGRPPTEEELRKMTWRPS